MHFPIPLSPNVFFYLLTALLLHSCNNIQEETIATHTDGTPKTIYGIEMQDGKKVRVYEKTFHENGQLRHQGYFSPTGERIKVWKYWFSDGQLFAESNFQKNTPAEQWKIHRHHPHEELSPNLPLNKIELTPDGCPVFCEYGTESQSVQYLFHSTFELMLQRPLLHNKPHGEAFGYDDKGNLISHHFYKEGKEDRKFMLLHGNGHPRIEGEYKDGEKIGIWTYYDSIGQILREENHNTPSPTTISSPSHPIYLDRDGNPIR